MFHLPTDILRLIYEYDDTYKKKYNDVMDELLIKENLCVNFFKYEEWKIAYQYVLKNYFKKNRKHGGISVCEDWPDNGDERILESFEIKTKTDTYICWIWK